MPYSADEIGSLAQDLVAIEDWLRDKCEARRATDMADVVERAISMLEDFYDDQRDRELGETE